MNQPASPALFSDKRLWLFLLSGALAVVLGFFAIPGYAAINLVSETGYWFELVAFVLFLRALWLTFRDDLRSIHWRRLDWASVAVVALAGIILLVHETFGFKIIMDEIMLLGTSMSMHFDKVVLTPTRGNDVQGAFVILDGIMDKRPLFFPFLVSLLHDLTGYRPANAFVLNGILTFILLGLTYVCGRMLAGRRAGWLGVLLLAGLPLLGQNATGGGFELLNIVMILATLLLGARFVQKRDEASFTALCFSTLLLGQVRYESLIYLLPVAILILWVWYDERRVILSWPVIFAPLLLLPYPLQHHIFELRTTAWQMGSEVGDKSNATVPFSLSYIPDNIYHAMKFFFARATDQPNSLTLSILGWIAVAFFLLFAVKSAADAAHRAAGRGGVGHLRGRFHRPVGAVHGLFLGPVRRSDHPPAQPAHASLAGDRGDDRAAAIYRRGLPTLPDRRGSLRFDCERRALDGGARLFAGIPPRQGNRVAPPVHGRPAAA